MIVDYTILSMLKNLVLLLFTSISLWGCTHEAKTNNVFVSHSSIKTNVVKSTQLNVQLTDSAKLVKHLDSLPKAVFPLEVSEWNGTQHIDLSEFKTKRLFKLRYKLIPRAIGAAGIDDDERIDSTFNLCDTNYKANWSLVIKTPKFFVVGVEGNYSLLVTIDYKLNVINAIHVAAADPFGNDHFHGELTSTIYKNLKIVMHYVYTQQGGEDESYATTDEDNEDDVWRIDRTGHFKPIRYKPN